MIPDPGREWPESTRGFIKELKRIRYSYRKITKLTGITRLTLQSIIEAKSSRYSRKGQANRKAYLTYIDT